MKPTFVLVHLVQIVFLLDMTMCAPTPTPQGAGAAFDMVSGAAKLAKTGAKGAAEEVVAAGVKSSVHAVDDAAGLLASSTKSAALKPVQVSDSELGKAMATLNGVSGNPTSPERSRLGI